MRATTLLEYANLTVSLHPKVGSVDEAPNWLKKVRVSSIKVVEPLEEASFTGSAIWDLLILSATQDIGEAAEDIVMPDCALISAVQPDILTWGLSLSKSLKIAKSRSMAFPHPLR
jgi:hypothetical protein